MFDPRDEGFAPAPQTWANEQSPSPSQMPAGYFGDSAFNTLTTPGSNAVNFAYAPSATVGFNPDVQSSEATVYERDPNKAERDLARLMLRVRSRACLEMRGLSAIIRLERQVANLPRATLAVVHRYQKVIAEAQKINAQAEAIVAEDARALDELDQQLAAVDAAAFSFDLHQAENFKRAKVRREALDTLQSEINTSQQRLERAVKAYAGLQFDPNIQQSEIERRTRALTHMRATLSSLYDRLRSERDSLLAAVQALAAGADAIVEHGYGEMMLLYRALTAIDAVRTSLTAVFEQMYTQLLMRYESLIQTESRLAALLTEIATQRSAANAAMGEQTQRLQRQLVAKEQELTELRTHLTSERTALLADVADLKARLRAELPDVAERIAALEAKSDPQNHSSSRSNLTRPIRDERLYTSLIDERVINEQQLNVAQQLDQQQAALTAREAQLRARELAFEQRQQARLKHLDELERERLARLDERERIHFEHLDERERLQHTQLLAQSESMQRDANAQRAELEALKAQQDDVFATRAAELAARETQLLEREQLAKQKAEADAQRLEEALGELEYRASQLDETVSSRLSHIHTLYGELQEQAIENAAARAELLRLDRSTNQRAEVANQKLAHLTAREDAWRLRQNDLLNQVEQLLANNAAQIQQQQAQQAAADAQKFAARVAELDQKAAAELDAKQRKLDAEHEQAMREVAARSKAHDAQLRQREQELNEAAQAQDEWLSGVFDAMHERVGQLDRTQQAEFARLRQAHMALQQRASALAAERATWLQSIANNPDPHADKQAAAWSERIAALAAERTTLIRAVKKLLRLLTNVDAAFAERVAVIEAHYEALMAQQRDALDRAYSDELAAMRIARDQARQQNAESTSRFAAEIGQRTAALNAAANALSAHEKAVNDFRDDLSWQAAQLTQRIRALNVATIEQDEWLQRALDAIAERASHLDATNQADFARAQADYAALQEAASQLRDAQAALAIKATSTNERAEDVTKREHALLAQATDLAAQRLELVRRVRVLTTFLAQADADFTARADELAAQADASLQAQRRALDEAYSRRLKAAAAARAAAVQQHNELNARAADLSVAEEALAKKRDLIQAQTANWNEYVTGVNNQLFAREQDLRAAAIAQDDWLKNALLALDTQADRFDRDIQKRLSDAQTALAAIDEQQQALDAERAALNDVKATTDARAAELDERTAKLVATAQQINTEREALIGRVRALNQAASAINERFETYAQDLDARALAHIQFYQTLLDQVYAQKLRDAQAQTDAQWQQFDAQFSERLGALNARAAALDATSEELDASQQALAAHGAELSAAREQLQAQARALAARAQAQDAWLNDALAALDTKANVLNHAAQNQLGQIHAAYAAVRDASAKNAAERHSLEVLQATASTRDAQLDAREQQAHALLAQLVQQRQDLVRQVQKLNTQAAAYDAAFANHVAAIDAQLQARLMQAQSEFAAAKRQLAADLNAVAKARAANDARAAQLTAATDEFVSAQTDLIKRHEQLRAIDAQLADQAENLQARTAAIAQGEDDLNARIATALSALQARANELDATRVAQLQDLSRAYAQLDREAKKAAATRAELDEVALNTDIKTTELTEHATTLREIDRALRKRQLQLWNEIQAFNRYAFDKQAELRSRAAYFDELDALATRELADRRGVLEAAYEARLASLQNAAQANAQQLRATQDAWKTAATLRNLQQQNTAQTLADQAQSLALNKQHLHARERALDDAIITNDARIQQLLTDVSARVDKADAFLNARWNKLQALNADLTKQAEAIIAARAALAQQTGAATAHDADLATREAALATAEADLRDQQQRLLADAHALQQLLIDKQKTAHDELAFLQGEAASQIQSQHDVLVADFTKRANALNKLAASQAAYDQQLAAHAAHLQEGADALAQREVDFATHLQERTQALAAIEATLQAQAQNQQAAESAVDTRLRAALIALRAKLNDADATLQWQAKSLASAQHALALRQKEQAHAAAALKEAAAKKAGSLATRESELIAAQAATLQAKQALAAEAESAFAQITRETNALRAQQQSLYGAHADLAARQQAIDAQFVQQQNWFADAQHALSDRNALVDAKAQALKDETAQLKAQHDLLSGQLRAQAEDLNAQQRAFRDRTLQLNVAATKAADHFRDALASLKHREAQLDRQSTTQLNAIQAAYAQLMAAQAKQSAATQDLLQLDAAIDDKATTLNTQWETLQAQEDELVKARNALAKEVAVFAQHVSQTDASTHAAATRLSVAAQSLANENAAQHENWKQQALTIQTAAKKLMALQAAVHANEQELANRHEALDQYAQSLSAREYGLLAHETEINDARTALNATRNELKANNAIFAAAVAQKQASLTAAFNALAKREQALDALSAQRLNELQQAYAELARREQKHALAKNNLWQLDATVAGREAQVQKQLIAIDEEAVWLQAQRENLLAQVSRFNSEVNNVDAQVKANVKNLHLAAQDLAVESAAQQTWWNQKAAAFANDVKALHAKHAVLEKERAELAARAEALNDREFALLHEQAAADAALAKRVAAFNQHVTKTDASTRAAATRLSAAAQSLANENAAQQEHWRQEALTIQAAAKKLAALQAATHANEQQLANRHEALDQYAESLTAREYDLVAQETEINDARATLNTTRNELKANNAILAAAVAQKQARLTAAFNALAKREQALDALSAQRLNELQEAYAELARREQKHALAKNNLWQLDATVAGREAQVQRQLAAIEKEDARLQAQRENLLAQVSRFNNEVNNVDAQVKANVKNLHLAAQDLAVESAAQQTWWNQKAVAFVSDVKALHAKYAALEQQQAKLAARAEALNAREFALLQEQTEADAATAKARAALANEVAAFNQHVTKTDASTRAAATRLSAAAQSLANENAAQREHWRQEALTIQDAAKKLAALKAATQANEQQLITRHAALDQYAQAIRAREYDVVAHETEINDARTALNATRNELKANNAIFAAAFAQKQARLTAAFNALAKREQALDALSAQRLNELQQAYAELARREQKHVLAKNNLWQLDATVAGREAQVQRQLAAIEKEDARLQAQRENLLAQVSRFNSEVNNVDAQVKANAKNLYLAAQDLAVESAAQQTWWKQKAVAFANDVKALHAKYAALEQQQAKLAARAEALNAREFALLHAQTEADAATAKARVAQKAATAFAANMQAVAHKQAAQLKEAFKLFDTQRAQFASEQNSELAKLQARYDKLLGLQKDLQQARTAVTRDAQLVKADKTELAAKQKQYAEIENELAQREAQLLKDAKQFARVVATTHFNNRKQQAKVDQRAQRLADVQAELDQTRLDLAIQKQEAGARFVKQTRQQQAAAARLAQYAAETKAKADATQEAIDDRFAKLLTFADDLKQTQQAQAEQAQSLHAAAARQRATYLTQQQLLADKEDALNQTESALHVARALQDQRYAQQDAHLDAATKNLAADHAQLDRVAQRLKQLKTTTQQQAKANALQAKELQTATKAFDAQRADWQTKAEQFDANAASWMQNAVAAINDIKANFDREKRREWRRLAQRHEKLQAARAQTAKMRAQLETQIAEAKTNALLSIANKPDPRPLQQAMANLAEKEAHLQQREQQLSTQMRSFAAHLSTQEAQLSSRTASAYEAELSARLHSRKTQQLIAQLRTERETFDVSKANELTRIEREHAALTRRAAELDRRDAKLREAASKLARLKLTIGTERGRFDKELAMLERQRAKIARGAERLRAEEAAAMRRLEGFAAEIAAQKRATVQAAQTVAQSEARFSAERADWMREMADREREVDALQATATRALNEKENAMREQSSTLKIQAADLAARDRNLRFSEEKMRLQIDALQTLRADINSEYRELDAAKNAAVADIKAQRTELDDKEERLKRLYDKVRALRLEQQHKQKEIETREQKAVAAQKEIERRVQAFKTQRERDLLHLEAVYRDLAQKHERLSQFRNKLKTKQIELHEAQKTAMTCQHQQPTTGDEKMSNHTTDQNNTHAICPCQQQAYGAYAMGSNPLAFNPYVQMQTELLKQQHELMRREYQIELERAQRRSKELERRLVQILHLQRMRAEDEQIDRALGVNPATPRCCQARRDVAPEHVHEHHEKHKHHDAHPETAELREMLKGLAKETRARFEAMQSALEAARTPSEASAGYDAKRDELEGIEARNAKMLDEIRSMVELQRQHFNEERRILMDEYRARTERRNRALDEKERQFGMLLAEMRENFGRELASVRRDKQTLIDRLREVQSQSERTQMAAHYDSATAKRLLEETKRLLGRERERYAAERAKILRGEWDGAKAVSLEPKTSPDEAEKIRKLNDQIKTVKELLDR